MDCTIRDSIVLLLAKCETLDAIIINLRLLGQLNKDSSSIDVLYRYIGFIKAEKIPYLCQYVSLIQVVLAVDVVIPEMFLLVLLREEMYDIATKCIKYCNRNNMNIIVPIILDLIQVRIDSGKQKLYDKAIRLSLWLLNQELIQNKVLPLHLQDLFNVWSTNL